MAAVPDARSSPPSPLKRPARRSLSPTAAFLLLLTWGCGPAEEPDWNVGYGFWPVHTVCGTSTSIVEGIDVSKWQGTVNWTSVKGAGIQYAFARISDGTTYPDSYFSANWSGMSSAGIIRGAYQYFRPDQDPLAQANLVLQFLQNAGGMKAGDLPVVLDLETTGGLSASAILSNVQQWIARVKQGTGLVPIIYTGSYFWDGSISSSAYATYPLWIAHYTTASCPLVPNPWSAWKFWQYTSSGSVSGVSGNVDRDRFDGTLSDLKAFAAASVIPKADAGAPDTSPQLPDQGKKDKGTGDTGAGKTDRGRPDAGLPVQDDGSAQLGRDEGVPPVYRGQPGMVLEGGCATAGVAPLPRPPVFFLLLLAVVAAAAVGRRATGGPPGRR